MPEAVSSLLNFGLRCGWFGDEQEAKENIPAIVSDYIEYYKFWDSMASKDSRVIVINHKELLNKPAVLENWLRDRGFQIKKSINVDYAEINMSPKSRRRFFTAEMIEAYLSESSDNPAYMHMKD